MSYQKRLHHLLVASLAALALAVTTVSAAEPDPIDDTDLSNAVEHIAGVYYAYSAGTSEKQLTKAGLAKPEIDDAVDTLAKGFAECIVTALHKTENDESAHVIKLLADGTAIEDISRYMSSLETTDTQDPFAVFEAESDACTSSVDAGYGLPD